MEAKFAGLLLMMISTSVLTTQVAERHCHVPMMCKDDQGFIVPTWTDVQSSLICKNTNCDCTKLIEELARNITELENRLAALSSTTPSTSTTAGRDA